MNTPTPPRHAPQPAQPPSAWEMGRREGIAEALRIVRTHSDSADGRRVRDNLSAVARQLEKLL